MKNLLSQIGTYREKAPARFIYEVGQKDEYYEGDIPPSELLNNDQKGKEGDYQYKIEQGLYGKNRPQEKADEYDMNYEPTEKEKSRQNDLPDKVLRILDTSG